MEILNRIKKDPIGSANNAKDIAGVADSARDAGVNAVNNNQVETAKSLSGLLLNILGILSAMPGGGTAADVAAAGVNRAIGLYAVWCGTPRPHLAAAGANGLAGRCLSLDIRR